MNNTNRVIKFRAWDKNESKFHYDISINSDGVAVSSWGKDKYDWVAQQFTGLTTQGGTEIYEGDIFNTLEARWKVIYADGAFYGEVTWSAVIKIGEKRLLSELIDRIVPLGNIYENPELLEPLISFNQ